MAATKVPWGQIRASDPVPVNVDMDSNKITNLAAPTEDHDAANKEYVDNHASSGGAFVYIAYASDASGTDFTMTFNPALDYIAILATSSEISSPQASDFTGLWKNYQGADGEEGATGAAGSDGSDGVSAFVYIAYASDASGADFTMTFNPALDYIAILATSSEISSPQASDFTGLWKNYKGADGSGSGSTSFWSDVEGSPTRASDTQFTLTGDYTRLLSKATVLIWDESGTWQCGMVVSSSYSSPNTTVNIAGCSLSAGFSGMQYALQKGERLDIIIPGTHAVADNPIGGAARIPVDAYPLAVDWWVAATGTTNALTAELNDDGSAIGGNASIGSGTLTDLGNSPTNPTTAIVADSVMTVDITAIQSTPGEDLHLRLWYMPIMWRDIT